MVFALAGILTGPLCGGLGPRRSGLLLGTLLLGLGTMGCSVVSPPPLLARHDGPEAARVGDVRILLLAGLGGGIWVDGGWGLALRASVQAADDVEAGGELAVAFSLETRRDADTAADTGARQPGASANGAPEDAEVRRVRLVASARGFGRFDPGHLSWLAVESGAGVGFTDTGLVYLTVDAGSSLGYEVELGGAGGAPGGGFLFYGGPLLALSVPVARGAPLDGAARGARHAATTFWYGASFGLGLASRSALDVGSTLELTGLWALSSEDEAFLLHLTLGTGASFVP
jgi:hypothetical protein